MTVPPTKQPINIKFSDIAFTVAKGKGKKNILKGVSGRFLSGQISAILGPSGAGKTTLMNILAGYKSSKISGEILVNEEPRCLKSLRKQSCYIMQNEQLLPFLTVQESMEAAAALKLGNNYSKASKKKTIDDILSTISLNKIKQTRASNLSGGEKKRLLIAFELINNPPVMFFDEPTSGLDSHNGYQCIVLLKKLAEEGRTIICTIHQPSARLFEKFDYVYFLAEGHCVYRGNVSDLFPFISSLSLQCPDYHNPADFLIEASSGEYGNYLSTMVHTVNSTLYSEGGKSKQPLEKIDDMDAGSKELSLMGSTEENQRIEVAYTSKEKTIIELPSLNKYFLSRKDEDFAKCPASFWTQLYVLLLRSIRSILRDEILTLFRLIFHIISAIFVGLLYYHIGNEASSVLNNYGLIILCILFYMITAAIPTLATFPLEIKVLVRENQNNWYSLKAYYLAKTLGDAPFQILFSFIFISIIYVMTNQPREVVRFLLIVAIGILNSLISQSVGLIVGAAMEIKHAMIVAPLVLIPTLLLSGFAIVFSAIPIYLRWLTYLSYVRYCYEGTLRITYGLDRNFLHCSEDFCYFKFPRKMLDLYDVQDKELWPDFLILILFYVFIRLLGYFILKWKIRKERE